MEVNCAGCAGCCIDWRALSPVEGDHERRGPREPLDDAYNLVPLTRDDVRDLVENGLGDAMTPRLWEGDSDVDVDGTTLAAVDGKPAFFVGLRKPPKPVSPFDTAPGWLPTCAFLDPTTLQCRIHDSETYPEECAEYPGHNLALAVETECERVEAAFGGERLLDDGVPEGLSGLLLGPQAIGQKVFVHPDPDELGGVIERLRAGRATDADRAEFVAWALASSPGTTDHDPKTYEWGKARVLETSSWVGESIAEWEARSGDDPDPTAAREVEEARGAPETPGWDG
ncbi:YkgJ family cysteine cluster protein [Halalkalicoccus sp. NIPERK01]|uniref:YkgJ family cysteine cluster protein n=1 Tax=Halalkalicoccus sp. NIPERK01 TaxID=3053469 RepID=UPI00256EE6A0|nr:YkgJ family cysteine cluster protein [Halalkalicoccus sp. NIPERK01]MDL5362802.1 YkgJ family cysteine cluster protein [Halalkalicoccus sp. NIPERK01]